MPKISVIIPVYNSEKYLIQCLDSVINQSLKDIEIICIDDGSTDDSFYILNKYAKNDRRIKIIRQKNLNCGVARNNGLKIAKGEFVHFLDSDDWIEINAYEQLYKIIKNTGADLVKFRAYSYNNETGEITTNNYLDIADVDEKFFDNYLSINNDTEDIICLPDAAWTGIYKREFLEKNNIYFDDFICTEDTGFFYRCIVNAEKVYLSPKRFVYYRQNLKTSLVHKRAENFNCITALYGVIKNISKNLPPQKRQILINKIIDVCFYLYEIFLNNDELSFKTQIKIEKEMHSFLKQTSNEEIIKKNKKKYNKILFIKYKKLMQKVFSIRNIGTKKVLCIAGIKIKFKCKRLEQRENIGS